MRINLAKDSEVVTVHRIDPVPLAGPVFYASLPNGSGHSEEQELKHRLVSALWDHCVAMESPLWRHRQTSDRAFFPIQVLSGLLGRPHLLLGKFRGPAISFSVGGGKIWAALCGEEAAIGIDVAGGDEFQSEYPFYRVFQPDELHHAMSLVAGDRAVAAALLWSVKEAFVKALGCGFHLVDPRQITVYPAEEGAGGYTFPVGLSGKALVRFPMASGSSLRVHSLSQGKMWFSIARFKKRQAVHG